MTQFYCHSCDRYRDSNEEDSADYSGEDPVCGECVEDLIELNEQQFEQWAAAIDADPQWIEDNL